MKTKVARFLRVITAPPLMAAVLLIFLHAGKPEVFIHTADYYCALICLSGIPLLAYPLQMFIPRLNEGGRSVQRKLAFILSVVGYLLLLCYSFDFYTTHQYRCIAVCYAISVVLLTILNRITPYHASGHACSFAMLPLFLSYFAVWIWILPVSILGIGMVWSSLVLKRHTAIELLLGSVVCVVAYLISITIIRI